jgi:DNA-binding transcriptional LysR family regulator
VPTQHVLAGCLGEALPGQTGDALVVGPGVLGKGRVHALSAASEQARWRQRQHHPQLKIDFNASEGALNLVEARIDLAIRISAEPDPSLIGRVLAPCASVLVASPDYLAEHGVPQAPADLEHHRCLSFANFGKSTWALRRDDERSEVQVRSQLSANEATALLQAALAGGGVALQPTYLANPYLADGRLQAVLPDWQPPDMAIHALYPSRKHLSPAVRALLDFLVERFATPDWS